MGQARARDRGAHRALSWRRPLPLSLSGREPARGGCSYRCGSGWDISSYNPFRAMETAVTRAGDDPSRPPLNFEQRLPLMTAIDAYTINAAIALGQEGTIGSLEVGKRADLVILDRDILTVDPTTFGHTVVLSTWLD